MRHLFTELHCLLLQLFIKSYKRFEMFIKGGNDRDRNMRRVPGTIAQESSPRADDRLRRLHSAQHTVLSLGELSCSDYGRLSFDEFSSNLWML